jgi:DNA-directed RNA polymerase specialized sigma subunit
MQTVKALSLLVALLALIIGSGIFANRVLSSNAETLEKQINEIEEHTKNEDWDSALQSLHTINKEWPETSKMWTLLLDHVEIDNIDETIKRMSKYIETQNVPLALGEIAVLKQYIKHIPEKEKFSIKNVF